MKALIRQLLILSAPVLAVALAEEDAEVLAPAVKQAVREWLNTEAPEAEDDWPVYRAALAEHEALEPVLDHLEGDDSEKALWLRAKLHWRYGLLEKARDFYEKLSAEGGSPLAHYRVAQLWDASGKQKEAIAAYKVVLEREDAAAWHGAARLRLAILKTTGGKVEGELDDLSKYAEGQKQESFKNRAAVVLALAGKPKEALALYQTNAQENSGRYKQEIRVAEWAMAAKQASQAQEAAWRALRLAKLRRDRRYALTILSEAYRVDNKLPDLAQRFSKEAHLDEDSRFTWIGILRELGRADEALALFKKATDDGSVFTPEMRRELLEICRETGRGTLLVEAYREAMAQQPERVEWRAGLSRYFLERGDRESGRGVWDGFQEASRAEDLLAGAAIALELGLEELAVAYANHCIEASLRVMPALQFLFQMHRARGRDEEMVAVLERMEALAAPDSSDRVELAESWEQMGRQDEAADVLERLRAARGPENFSADLEMRLAWLYSETGEEEKAYEYWRKVWLRVESPGRRRYVEDRLMATASRLGKLADIAIELEEKLAAGKAEERDSGLLVRLYTKVGDPVSATEITQEFMKQSGGTEIQMLEEKARIYVMCNDYYHYEKTLRQLMERDPGGKPEYLTQLAMSCLERGKHDQARQALLEMRDLEQNAASAEFEAGVLKIAGMHEEATRTYWRGIVEHPDRIDAYLLLGRSLQTVGKARQAQGLFQYLVENAGQDDLFTIAVDGLLNARAGGSVMLWARRVVLQRIAEGEDKVFLYQLLADLSEELRDQQMIVRALSETLPIAGERRTAQLRELVELAKIGVGGSGFSGSGRTPSAKDRQGLMRFGRRLIGMGEAVPPQVHLDLGQAFLDGGDIRSAAKTFAKAEDVADYAGFQRRVASSFEQKRYIKSALRLYEKLLLGDHADVSTLLKLGELKEQLGRDDEATQAYERAMGQLIDRQPLVSAKNDANTAYPRYYWSANQDAYGKYFARAMKAYLATAVPGPAMDAFLQTQHEKLMAEMVQLSSIDRPEEDQTLMRTPRINKRAGLIRRVALGFDQPQHVKGVYWELVRAFPRDEHLLPSLCQTLLTWGLEDVAEEIITAFPDHPSAEAGRKYIDRLKAGGDGEALFQSLISGDHEKSRLLLHQAAADADGRVLGGLTGDLLAAALFLRDARTVRFLARKAMLATPSDQVWNYASILGRVWPHLDESSRHDLVDLVEGKLRSLKPTRNSSMTYYIQQLNRLTGRQFRLGREHVRPRVQVALAQGGHQLSSLGGLFNALGAQDYGDLLKEAFAKAKKSDRLTILFTLIKAYEGEMDPDLRDLFTELAEEAGAKRGADVLTEWDKARAYYYGEREGQTSFAADLLGVLGAGQAPETRTAIDATRVGLFLQCDRVEEALALAKEVQKAALVPDSKIGQGRVQGMQRSLMPTHLSVLLEAFAEVKATGEGHALELAKAKIALIRQAGDRSLLITHLKEAATAFPEESSFQEELWRLLESMGFIWDAIQMQSVLVAKDPANEASRNRLATLWTRLEHPLKAKKAKEMPKAEPRPASAGVKVEPEKQAKAPAAVASPPKATPAKPLKASASTNAQAIAAPQQARKASEAGSEEVKAEKLPVANVAAVKKAAEEGKAADAQLLFRRVWRQFPNLDAPRYYSSRGNVGLFVWPRAAKAGQTSKPGSPMGGMKQFLARTRTDPAANRKPAPPLKTIFEALGEMPEIQAEVRKALRGLEPHEQMGDLFRRQIGALARRQVSSEGLDEAVTSALAALKDETTGDPIDRAVAFALLEIASEADTAPASLPALRDALLARVKAGDTDQLVRLARRLAHTGQTDRAVGLYRWCAGKITFSPYSYSDGRPTTRSLVNDIRQHLDGEDCVRALESVFELSRPGQSDDRTMSPYYMLVLNTWKEVLPAEETLSRTRTICEEVLREYPENPTLTKLASVFLGSGGAVDQGVAALEKFLTAPPPMGRNGMIMVYNSNGTYYYTSSRSSQSQIKLTDADLRMFFPESMASWRRPGAWLERLSGLIGDLSERGRLSSLESARLLALTAVHQHDLGFTEAAEQTFHRLMKIPLVLPDHRFWVWDAAEHLGMEDVWREIGLAMLKGRHLNIHRIPALLESVARADGVDAALALARDTLDYTMHPAILGTAMQLASSAGKDWAYWEEQQAALLKQAEQPDRYGFLLVANDASTLYRYQELEAEKEIRDHVGGTPHVITFHEPTGRVRAVRETAAGHETLPLPMAITAEWRRDHPEGNVYLISLLENAKTYLVNKGADGWRYYENDAPPGKDWAQPSFDASTWKEGAAPLGFGEPVSTTLSLNTERTLTAYFRKTVHLADPGDVMKAYAGIECDDGSILYLNGKEIYRMNMNKGDEDTATLAGRGEKGKTESFFIDAGLFRKGDNVIAVRVYQADARSSDLYMDFELRLLSKTDLKKPTPPPTH